MDSVEVDNPEMRDQFVAAFNAVEPKSDFEPDAVYLIGSNQVQTSVIVFAQDGCVIFAVPAPNQAIMLLLQGIVPGRQKSSQRGI